MKVYVLVRTEYHCSSDIIDIYSSEQEANDVALQLEDSNELKDLFGYSVDEYEVK